MPGTTVAVRVQGRWETCDRWTYTVQLESGEGYTKDAVSFRTGSKVNDYVGLTRDEARERALIEAVGWADFHQLEPVPFVEDDGKTYEPRYSFKSYEARRQMEARKADRADGAD